MIPTGMCSYLRRPSILLALSSSVWLSACIKVDVLRLDGDVRPASGEQSIRVLATEPTEPYAVIALVSVSSSDRGVDALRHRLIREAARLGGHAVLLDAQSLTRTDESRLLTAKVIVFERSSR